jgi:hypothetical protein
MRGNLVEVQRGREAGRSAADNKNVVLSCVIVHHMNSEATMWVSGNKSISVNREN